MLRLVLFVGVIFTISAQPPADASAQPEQANPESLDQSIFVQVQAERSLSKQYIDLVLRTQRAQYNSMAGSIIYKKFLKSQKSDSLEDSLFSAQTLFPTANPEEDDDPQADAKGDLLAAYYLLSAVDIQSHQIITEAADIQEQFYLDRKLSLAVQMLGSTVPQQLVQFVNLKQLSTYLKTLKLSYALQVVSHWRMWLEDELDVNTVRVTNPGDVAVILEQKEPIIRDRLFAFSSYQTYAQIDVQIFLLDLFLAQSISQDSSLGSLGLGSLGSSFLEVQSQFIPFMVHQQNPQLYSVMYKYYSLLYQFYAAQSGFAAAQLDSAALKEEDLEKATKHIDEARKLHQGGFAQSLLTGAQLEYMDAIFQVSNLFGGAAGSFGSLGGSLGGSFAPQPHYEQTAPAAPPAQEPYVKH